MIESSVQALSEVCQEQTTPRVIWYQGDSSDSDSQDVEPADRLLRKRSRRKHGRPPHSNNSQHTQPSEHTQKSNHAQESKHAQKSNHARQSNHAQKSNHAKSSRPSPLSCPSQHVDRHVHFLENVVIDIAEFSLEDCPTEFQRISTSDAYRLEKIRDYRRNSDGRGSRQYTMEQKRKNDLLIAERLRDNAERLREEIIERSREEVAKLSREEEAERSRDEKAECSRQEVTKRSRDEKSERTRGEKAERSREDVTERSRGEAAKRARDKVVKHSRDDKAERSRDYATGQAVKIPESKPSRFCNLL